MRHHGKQYKTNHSRSAISLLINKSFNPFEHRSTTCQRTGERNYRAVLKNNQNTIGHLPSSPLRRGKLSPDFLFTCLSPRKVTSSRQPKSSALIYMLLCLLGRKLTLDSGSSIAAFQGRMRRSDNAVAGSHVVTVYVMRCLMQLINLLY